MNPSRFAVGALKAFGRGAYEGAAFAAGTMVVEIGIVKSVSAVARAFVATDAVVAEKAAETVVAAEAKAVTAPAAAPAPVKMLPQKAGPVGHIPAGEVSGKTPAEVAARARELGLQAKGRNPGAGQGSYIDPQTKVQRIMTHPNASSPHGHVNNAAGQRIGADGSVVPKKSEAAHLPMKNN